MQGNKSEIVIQSPRWQNWLVVPLRLFLGVTFLYAGWQKLTDPQFFNPSTNGYIGKQIMAMAAGSPLKYFLLHIAAPHAMLFGILTAYGELAIGLGVLVGCLLRPASIFGFLINLLFFLTATWRVFPFFYGSDIVFMACWVTLFIAGPTNQALPAIDSWLVLWLIKHTRPDQQQRTAVICTWLFGVNVAISDADADTTQPLHRTDKQRSTSRYREWQLEQARQQARRNFIWGLVTGGAAIGALAWLAETLHWVPGSSANAATSTPAASATGTSGSVIAQISNVPTNSSLNFTLSSNSDPGLLIHLSNGNFVAYDAVCTHAGCTVDYDANSGNIVCPCHGATFDPANAAAVVHGPALIPLTSVPITVDHNAGTISLGS
jgi:thiosulfate dehydrogenase [quinone] large subunit